MPKWRATMAECDVDELRTWLRGAEPWEHDRDADRELYRMIDTARRFLRRKAAAAEAETARLAKEKERAARLRSQTCLHTTGWVASSDVWEELDALERGAQVAINGKTLRLVAGSTSHDKLFEVVNRGCGLQRFFTLPDAVDFALRGELYPHPAFADPYAPRACPQCAVLTKPRVKGSPALASCYVCMLDMCWTCISAHEDQHDADPAYRLAPTAAQLQAEAEEYGYAMDVVRGIEHVVRGHADRARYFAGVGRKAGKRATTKKRPSA